MITIRLLIAIGPMAVSPLSLVEYDACGRLANSIADLTLGRMEDSVQKAIEMFSANSTHRRLAANEVKAAFVEADTVA